MSQIAFVTWNGGGNLGPALAIACELRRRGAVHDGAMPSPLLVRGTVRLVFAGRLSSACHPVAGTNTTKWVTRLPCGARRLCDLQLSAV